MSIQQIKDLPVLNIAAANCHLYLWTINKYLRETFEIVDAWGFKFSCMLTWCKPRHGLGLGGAFVQTTEHLFFCRRGSLPSKTRIDATWFELKRGRHSEKPQFFRIMIEEVSGDLPRIELFARVKYAGWDVWGNQVDNGGHVTPQQLWLEGVEY